MTATGWTAPSSAKAAIPCPPSSSRNIYRSRDVRPISSSWSRKAPSGTGSPKTSSGTYNCVLLTGNGQPPRGVRRLARRLHEEKRLPVYVLVDNDPWGYYIYSVIKQGSINLAFESQRMAIPQAKFIGLSSG